MTAASGSLTGDPAAGPWSAPGRVNLIGEHTDYNGGLALPMAIPQRTTVTVDDVDTPRYVVTSPGHGTVTFEASTTPGEVTGWAAYVAGTVWALGQAGVPLRPAALTVSSDVPTGAGLSSSAALECAVGCAVLGLSGTAMGRRRLAGLAQQAENDYVGAPTGGMDQLASTGGTAGNAVLVDVARDTLEAVPFDLAAVGLELLVIDTRAAHRHADGAYGQRRRACEQGAAALGVRSLREVQDEPHDAVLAALADLDGGVVLKRVRHILTENARVAEVVALLRSGSPRRIGPLLTASHASLRDDFEVTVPELDTAVDAALAAGALGARMTGGGFGGAAIALVETTARATVETRVRSAFADAGFTEPAMLTVTAADGAGPLCTPDQEDTPR